MAAGGIGQKSESNQTNENYLKSMTQNNTPDARQIAEGLINYLKEENLTRKLPEIISYLKSAGSQELTEAKVETAVELNANERETVKELLTKQIDWNGAVKFELNPEILGGMKITVGDKVLDLSVKGKLKDIYEQI
jgi:F-type H+-transporting ATPase subunit delta